MPRLKAANNARTTLVANISASATSFQVADASAFPDSGPFRITIDAEIMEVGTINKATNTFSNVQRGMENTAASTHNAGATVELRFTAGTYDELADVQTVNAHKSANPIDHPDGSVTLAKIAAADMTSPGGTEPSRLAVTNASGRVGDSERVGGVLASALARVAQIDIFTASGTWVKPSGAKVVYVQVISGGGGGGGGNGSNGGGGGGGGGNVTAWIDASLLPDSVPVTVGAGGAGGSMNQSGSDGGNSEFAGIVSSGGGGGERGSGSGGYGGRGGGRFWAANNQAGVGHQGAGAPQSTSGQGADHGGAAGGRGHNTGAGGSGGSSIGGGGGGGGGTSIGTTGRGGSSVLAGAGGNGASGSNKGQDGSAPAGGGGGGGSEGAGGNGGRGEVRVITFF